MTIAKKIKEQRGSLYQQAAEKFSTNYQYVAQLARDPHRGKRGKGKLIKEWLEEQLNK